LEEKLIGVFSSDILTIFKIGTKKNGIYLVIEELLLEDGVAILREKSQIGISLHFRLILAPRRYIKKKKVKCR